MIKQYRWRKLFAPAAGLRQAILVFILGGMFAAIGSALSFHRIIEPNLEKLKTSVDSILAAVITQSDQREQATWFIGGGLLLLGSYIMLKGWLVGWQRVLETLFPGESGSLDIYVRRQQLAQGPRIVALGGGTGLSTILRGLKQHSSNITAIVTVTDEGGSSGRLIHEKGMIPPGDIRNCLVALADAEKAMTDLFQHRFQKDSGSLSGHSMGNLLIAALFDQAHGDFEKAIEAASDVLNIRGRVVPSTLDRGRLRALLDNGMEVCGETAISQSGHAIREVFLEPDGVQPHKEAIEAIKNAELICVGPGSVYTSVVPNLLVPGIVEALRDSKAKKVYICNVMTQPGESDTFSASEHVVAVQLHAKAKAFDYVLVNTGVPSQAAIDKYKGVGQHFVEPDVDRVRALGFRVITADLLNESDYLRHDPMRVASRLMDLLNW
jgi:uncharacterized cofD-like protein